MVNVEWLPWPSRISSRCVPTVGDFVYLSKCWIHSRPLLSFVQPLSLTCMTQLAGSCELSRYQASRWTFPSRIMNGGRAHPPALMHSITVVQRRSPGYMTVARPTVSTTTTFEDPGLAIPIAKPVSSKLYVSRSLIPYSIGISLTRLNHSVMILGSSFLARCVVTSS